MKYNKTKSNNSPLIGEGCGSPAWHRTLVTVDYKVHMLVFSSSWWWGCAGVEERTRTSCYIKTNLRGKQCLRPPLTILQVVMAPDIFKSGVVEAIWFVRCEQSSALSSCLSDSQLGTYRDKCELSAAYRRKKKRKRKDCYWCNLLTFRLIQSLSCCIACENSNLRPIDNN